jgi:hypothetical protein
LSELKIKVQLFYALSIEEALLVAAQELKKPCLKQLTSLDLIN